MVRKRERGMQRKSLNERLEKECIIAIKKDIAKKPVQRLKKD
jgi:hypothetical protein